MVDSLKDRSNQGAYAGAPDAAGFLYGCESYGVTIQTALFADEAQCS